MATLGEDGKVTPDQLPNAVDAIPLAQKGAAGGVATLDGTGLVPGLQLPKGSANGVASLDGSGRVPASQLPVDQPNGIAGLNGAGVVPAARLDLTAQQAAIAALQGQMAKALGVNQTWQDVGPNRAFGSSFVNSTGRPILVSVNGTIAAANANYACTTNGRFAVRQAWPDSFIGGSGGVTFMVPAGDTYVISQTGISGTTWWEYR
ncbi:hypothetical protein D3C71_1477240 [compost metagenome]